MKNPWLSMWLSAANTWAGAFRGVAAAESARAWRGMYEQALRQSTAMWTEPAPTPARARRRRR